MKNIRIDVKIKMCQFEEMDCIGSGHELLEGPCECGIEPLGSISYRVCNHPSHTRDTTDDIRRNGCWLGTWVGADDATTLAL